MKNAQMMAANKVGGGNFAIRLINYEIPYCWKLIAPRLMSAEMISVLHVWIKIDSVIAKLPRL